MIGQLEPRISEDQRDRQAASSAIIARLIIMLRWRATVDQRRLADRSGRCDHFGGEQEAERGGAGDEAGADQAHHRLRRECRAPARRRVCARDHPEADLPHLLGDRGLVALGEVAGDDRAKDRVEAGLQLGRQRRDLLRDIIDADDRPARRTGRARRCRCGAIPIRPRRRRRAARCAAPCATASPDPGCQPRGNAVALQERDDRGDQRRRPSTAHRR